MFWIKFSTEARVALAFAFGALGGSLCTRLLQQRRAQLALPAHADEAISSTEVEGSRGGSRTAVEHSAGVPSPVAQSDGERSVVCEDALVWLKKSSVLPSGSFVFTSLPDVSEVKEFAPTFEAWQTWFREAVHQVLEALPSESLAVFYQTDIRMPAIGQVSKAFLVLESAAKMEGVSLLWHKIVHFGSTDKPSPSVSFTHLLCFYKGVAIEDVDPGSMVPDLVNRGDKPWGLKNSVRCMGVSCTALVLKWISRRFAEFHTVVDPFCGAGTVLAIANHLGFDAVGVDISPRRVKQAKALNGAALLAGRQGKESCLQTGRS